MFSLRKPHTLRLSSGLLRLDEREPHIDSLAKKAVAFFRMSRSIRSCRFSHRSRRSSSSSPVLTPSRTPASTSNWRTQLRTADSVKSRSRATSPTERGSLLDQLHRFELELLRKLPSLPSHGRHLRGHYRLISDVHQTRVRPFEYIGSSDSSCLAPLYPEPRDRDAQRSSG